MGGKLSHEYHFIHSSGEDKVWSCNECEYVANEELVEHKTSEEAYTDVTCFAAISADHKTRINMWVGMPKPRHEYNALEWDQYLNPHAIRKAAEALDIELATGLERDTLKKLLNETENTVSIYDTTLRNNRDFPQAATSPSTRDIKAVLPGDTCPKCEKGELTPKPGIEVGHTFHLGTRYSEPLNAVVAMPNNTQSPVHMGCHGIGVSRLIGAVAALLHDEKGLNWPRAIAPFEVVLMAAPGIPEEEVTDVYERLANAGVDVVLDDRAQRSLGWKLKDADLIGYPVIGVLGKAWKEEGMLEVQCRRLGYKGLMEDFGPDIVELLEKL
jgi:prolyl-tRNA synthetase